MNSSEVVSIHCHDFHFTVSFNIRNTKLLFVIVGFVVAVLGESVTSSFYKNNK